MEILIKPIYQPVHTELQRQTKNHLKEIRKQKEERKTAFEDVLIEEIQKKKYRRN